LRGDSHGGSNPSSSASFSARRTGALHLAQVKRPLPPVPHPPVANEDI
jgi:hypothetical protein